MKEFWVWILYGCAQSGMIVLVCFWASQDSAVSSGKSFTFWAGGHHVYMNCVLLANVIILKMQHNFTGFNGVICLFQVISFFAILYYFSIEFQTGVTYRFMDEFVSSITAWLACFFILASLWTIDHMLMAIRLFIEFMYESYEDRAAVLEKAEARLGMRTYTKNLENEVDFKVSASKYMKTSKHI